MSINENQECLIVLAKHFNPMTKVLKDRYLYNVFALCGDKKMKFEEEWSEIVKSDRQSSHKDPLIEIRSTVDDIYKFIDKWENQKDHVKNIQIPNDTILFKSIDGDDLIFMESSHNRKGILNSAWKWPSDIDWEAAEELASLF